jgi:hypothetical protein
MEISEEKKRMIRNLIVLGCTALLTIGLSFGSFAGSAPDADSDGVPDAYDNCVNTPNGPLLATGNCSSQEDYDGNGYGQPCDTDVNNDGSTGLDDIAIVITAQGNGADDISDFNCDLGVGLDDLATALSQITFTPGPSGLSCAAPTATNCVAQ